MHASRAGRERGMALMAVLFALTLLMLLTLPFAVSMGVGADAAMRDVEATAVEQATASAREVLLAEAALSHPSIDPTPTHDDLEEYPSELQLPKTFAGIADEGRVLLGGQVVDLQRYLQLDSASPLLFANAIGTTTRLAEELAPDARTLKLEDAANLPDTGVLSIGDELIRYGTKNGNELGDLERGLLHPEFSDGKQPHPEGSLALDYRCVMAAAWPFLGGDETRQKRRPYRSVGEVLESAKAGFGTFTAAEIDALQRVFAVDTMAAGAATWGRPERIFGDLKGGESKIVEVKSALHIGAGSTVRLRNLRSGDVEYALVMRSGTRQGPQGFGFTVFQLQLLLRVARDFPAIDTVLEPLLPAPVNVNTAPPEVLMATVENVRQGALVRTHEGDGARPTMPRPLSAGDARSLVDQIVALRRPAQAPGQGPFTGWRDLVDRVWKPRFESARSVQETQLWVALYRNLQTGRDSSLEMGTVPLGFESGPWVAYRAAASRSRSREAAGVVARHERSGVAAAVPGFTLLQRWATQEDFEDAFALDRRAPFWVTHPVNLGALQPASPGNDPSGRYVPHLYALAFPQMGFGELRFPTVDDADAGVQSAPATAPLTQWAGALTELGGVAQVGVETMSHTRDVRGHDVAKDGPYKLENSGPSAGGTQPAPNANASGRGQGRHDKLRFPFSNPYGYADRFAVSAWFEPQSLANVTLFDHGDGDPDRNRLSLRTRDDQLVFEVLDEAGIDPDPSQSLAGVERTASEWTVPLAELGQPAATPLHVSVSATSSRPGDLAVAVDGMIRGKAKFVTWLTSPLKLFDPTLGANRTEPNTPGNERFLEIQVESTEGFPNVGVLRIGLELFEYSSIRGNAFVCKYDQSLGGRGARQIGREHYPDIPLDKNGKPAIDVTDPQFRGANLDVFPAHPAGSQVELYGYSAVLSEGTAMMPGTTQLDTPIGEWVVARGYIDNPRPITIQMPQGPPFTIGTGLDEAWTGDLLLAAPEPTKPSALTYPPPPASEEICDGFSSTGGYALLVQVDMNLDRGVGATSASVRAGGCEVIRYQSRQGNKLVGVQRAQTLPGDDQQISRDHFDGRARKFVTNWEDWPLAQDPTKYWDDLPTLILWVLPLSIGVQNARALWDPVDTAMSEWVQLYPKGGDVNDTEWVRYDTIAQGKYLVRGNRGAWDTARFALTQSTGVENISLGPLGPNGEGSLVAQPPWPRVQPTSGYIGYTTRLEADYPQIRAARLALRFRGDPMWDFYGDGGARGDPNDQATSSHAHPNSVVMQCHRLQLLFGNYGAYSGRVGRLDRVALVNASGEKRPAVEWHTVNWAARRFDADQLKKQKPLEYLGPWPFQLVAFQAGVTGVFVGPPANTQLLEPRQFDRLVKFPSGELPAAYCAEPTLGAATDGSQPMQGFVDEVEVVQQGPDDLLLAEELPEDGKTFRVNRAYALNAALAVWSEQDRSVRFPEHGGLVAIDGEVLAYQRRADGEFEIAANGRGLLNTEPRAHDRGTRVRFLTHRPAAILQANVGPLASELPLQHRGALSSRYGTVLLGRELLHYTWVRQQGDKTLLEMPRWHPPGDTTSTSQVRGLFRGRYGTTPQGGVTGEPVIAFPFRHWDRHAERSDDPELAYFQLTTNEAPAFFRTLRWRQETVDPRVELVCMVRADSRVPWESEPNPAAGLWHLRGGTTDTAPHQLGAQASRLEVRFAAVYKPGAVDLESFRSHAWKTAPRVEDVRLEFDGQSRVFDEQVTAR